MTNTKKAKSYRDLPVWQRSKQFVVAIYAATKAMPKEERFGLTGQIRAAAVSVSANIAEGWGRGGRKELLRFCTISRGSLYEVDALQEIVVELGLLPRGSFNRANGIGDEVGRMLSGLRTALKAKTEG